MSTCGSSLRHIFESTITENSSSSSLIDSLSSSFKQIRPIKPHLDHSFTEIFGELHFKENPDPIYSSHSPRKPPSSNGCDNKWWNSNDKWWNSNDNGTDDSKKNGYQTSYHKRSDSFSSLNSESLQLCTEGLGSESLDYVEDLKIQFPGDNNSSDNNKNDNNNKNDYSCFKNSSYKMGEKVNYRGYSCDQYRKRRTSGNIFPPPISCIGETGKPGVCFQSYREDGRFVLKEIKIPTYERLQASREDGHLRLCLIQQSDQDDEYDDGKGEVVDNEDQCDEDDGRDKAGKEETEVRDDIEKGHF